MSQSGLVAFGQSGGDQAYFPVFVLFARGWVSLGQIPMHVHSSTITSSYELETLEGKPRYDYIWWTRSPYCRLITAMRLGH